MKRTKKLLYRYETWVKTTMFFTLRPMIPDIPYGYLNPLGDKIFKERNFRSSRRDRCDPMTREVTHWVKKKFEFLPINQDNLLRLVQILLKFYI